MTVEPTLLMSPATPHAKPFSKPITQCPYCDHVSPVGSKFCGECGAALHLMPCVHCGAVNDITASSVCYRCHQELHPNSTVAPVAPEAPAADTAPPKPDKPHAALAEIRADTPVAAPARQRPHRLVVGIVLLAFAAASYYAYRQRTLLGRQEPVPVDASVKAGSTPGDTHTGTITKAPADAPAATAPATAAATEKGPVAIPAPAPASAVANIAKSEANTARQPSPVRPAAVARDAENASPGSGAAIDISRARIEASKGLGNQAPNIGPCTDAVAALGLCTPETTPRRQ
ncbi:MAG: zinc ribbon domain-containing protein [Betaproteobacteria bacterium]